MTFHRASPAHFSANAAWDLAPLPGESIVSSVWRFAWRNHLSARQLKSMLNPAVFKNVSGWDAQSREAQFLGASHAKHRSAWWASSFRYCPLCLEHLYHSFWHQLLFLSHCPLDGAALRSTCYCCGALLIAENFDHCLLNKPYSCSKCLGPISGIEVNLDLRLAIQQCASEFASVFVKIERWWALMSPARKEVERLLPYRSVASYAPWLRPDTSAIQWVLATAPIPQGISTETRTLPQLIVFRWKVRLKPDPPTRIWGRRTSRDARVGLALQVYRATLRHLWRTISQCSFCDDTEYRLCQTLPLENVISFPAKVNLHVLAFITLRRSYETYYSSSMARPEKAVFEHRLLGFPFGDEFAERIRICWRAQFIAEYASIYWWLTAVRNGCRGTRDLRKENLTLQSAFTEYDFEQGHLVSGGVGFPAVDGIDLRLLPYSGQNTL